MSSWPLRLLTASLMLALPLVALAAGAVRLVPFLAMPLVVLGAPLIVKARGGGEEGDEDGGDDGDSDDGPGGNRRPDRGPMTPSGPTGELPLSHSTQGAWRLRGNGHQQVLDPGHRRSPHQPERLPRRVPSRPHVS